MNSSHASALAPGPAVALFCNTFLPYSQTFVWDEIRSHDRYRVEVFAWRRRNAALFPGTVRVARPWYPLTRRDSGFEKRFDEGGIDIVHAHFGWAGVLAAHYARRYSLPLVVTFHGYDVALLARKRIAPPALWPYTLRARKMLCALDLGLCASAELLEMLVEAGAPRDRLLEHRIGVDVERFRPAQRQSARFEVAMVGRFVEKKGFADGIHAFARFLSRTKVPARLSIAGGGPLERVLRQHCTSLGIAPQVEFLGEISHAAVAALLARTDVLLAPSAVAADGDRDSGLLSVKEASACECIPIATRHGGIPSIIDEGATGFLVPEHDIDGIADRLGLLATDPMRRRDMGRAARQKMTAEYDLHASVRRLEQHYDNVIRQRAPGARPAFATHPLARRPGQGLESDT